MSLKAASGRGVPGFVLISIGGCLLAAGASALLVWLLAGMAAPVAFLAPARELLLIEGVLFLAAGGGVAFLWRRRPGDDFPDKTRTLSPGIALCLLALALAAVVTAWPLAAFGQETFALLQTFGLRGALQSEYGGIILAPVLGALLAPVLEAAAALAFLVAPVLLVPAMRSGSRPFKRALLSLMLIQAALVLGSYSAAGMMAGVGRGAAESVVAMLRDDPRTDDAQARALLAWIARHNAVTKPLAGRLLWILAPSVALFAFAHRRLPRIPARTALSPEQPPATPPNLEGPNEGPA